MDYNSREVRIDVNIVHIYDIKKKHNKHTKNLKASEWGRVLLSGLDVSRGLMK